MFDEFLNTSIKRIEPEPEKPKRTNNLSRLVAHEENIIKEFRDKLDAEIQKAYMTRNLPTQKRSALGLTIDEFLGTNTTEYLTN